MIRSVVIADSSSLMALDNIGEIEILEKLYSKVSVTPEVEREFGLPLPEWIEVRSASAPSLRRPEITGLDPGEASSIALALESADSLLIIDEKKGRRVAEQLNIEIIGTVGILIKAKNAGLISSPETLLSRLESVEFRLNDVLKSLLLESDEKIH